MQRKAVVLGAAALLSIMAGLAHAADGAYTLAPGENRSVYQFGNLSGSLQIVTDAPVTVRWIHTGEKKEPQQVSGSIELRLPSKMDGALEVSNTNAAPVTVHVTEKTEASNLAQMWESFWGTAAGGKNSEINKAHREVKRLIKKIKKI